jgi:phosphoglycerate dehydrogenase-like enzyme
MYRCAILDDYQNAASKLAPWERLAGQVEVEAFSDHLADAEAVARRLADFDIVVAMRERTPFGRALIERLPKLKLLITTGARNASFDLKAAKAANVVVCGTGSIGLSAAELAFALLMALARNLPDETRAVRSNGWQVSLGVELAGAKLGLVGLGRLGSRVATIAKAFAMNVAAWSPNLTEERSRAAGVEHAASLDALLRDSDFVSIHIVLGPTTGGLIGARELSLMKPTARLINTSRGPIVDEGALVAALTERRIAAAALDVFDVEPLPPDHPFRSLDNVLATPHIGYVTEGNYRIFYGDALEDIEAWLAGTPVRVIEG